SFAQTICIDHLGNKWIGTNKGLVKLIGLNSSTLFDSGSTGLNINDIRGIAEDQNGNIWIATNGGGLIEYKGNH
ncbi:MAG: two-component regulator propeller domain-containing protein, partial [Ignavibacteriaceae bacterium]